MRRPFLTFYRRYRKTNGYSAIQAYAATLELFYGHSQQFWDAQDRINWSRHRKKEREELR